MDGKLFDRITRTLASSAPRRATLRATAAAALAGMSASIGGQITEAKKNRKNKKKRCRDLRQKCGGGKKCCNGSGLVKCREVTDPLKPQCDGVSGRRCCGLDGAKCDANGDDCQCCEGLRCKLIISEGVHRCGDVAT